MKAKVPLLHAVSEMSSHAAAGVAPLHWITNRRERAGVYRAARPIGPEVRVVLNRQQLCELDPRAVDPAFDRADRAAADLCSLLIGKSGGAYQDQRLALIGGQLVERLTEFRELDAAMLLRISHQGRRKAPVRVLDLAPALAILGAKLVAQDRKQPGGEVGARLKRIDIGERAQQRLLHEVVGAIDTARQRHCERAQIRHGGKNT